MYHLYTRTAEKLDAVCINVCLCVVEVKPAVQCIMHAAHAISSTRHITATVQYMTSANLSNHL